MLSFIMKDNVFTEARTCKAGMCTGGGATHECPRGCGQLDCLECTPGTTCCTSEGRVAESSVPCGDLVAEYRCVGNGCTSVRQRRTTQAHCDGTIARCNKDSPVVLEDWYDYDCKGSGLSDADYCSGSYPTAQCIACASGNVCNNGGCVDPCDLPLQSWSVAFCDSSNGGTGGDGWDSSMGNAIIGVVDGMDYWKGSGDCEFNTSCDPYDGSFTKSPIGTGLTPNMLKSNRAQRFNTTGPSGKACFHHMVFTGKNYFGNKFTLTKTFFGGSTCSGKTCIGPGAGCTYFMFNWSGTPLCN